MAELKIVRILVSVEAVEPEAGAANGPKKRWQVTFTAPDHRPAWSQSRKMVGVAMDTHAFPRPDPEEPDLPEEGEPHHDLCLGEDLEPLCEIYDRIVKRNIAGQDVSIFGKYLFDTLIGEKIWQAIIQLAQEEEAKLLELALAWQSGELDLHRLNWELMHDSNRFLASIRAKPPRSVTITRVLLDADHKSRDMDPIPKCLFLIGSDLTDHRIRPGAEYLGLLRQIDRSERAIHSRVLRTARLKPGDPERIVKAFSPQLVYLIAHGQFDGEGGAQLELRLDAPEKEYKRLRDPQAVFNLLAEGKHLPSMVVLSACNTGQLSGRVEIKGAHETAPMAAHLVKSGIPVVIGMAGEVADGACRHFTRRFGEAIVRGESLVAATAEGRRAAFAYDPTGEKAADWAFPAVFMSAGVKPDWVPSPGDSSSAPPIEKWVRSYHKKRASEPVFCGRHEFFDAYYDLFAPNEPSVIAAYVPYLTMEDVGGTVQAKWLGDAEGRGFGKTRLLRELTVQAIHDGHIPVVVSSDSRNWDPPRTLPKLLTALLAALNMAQRTYGLTAINWQVQQLRQLLDGKDAELAPNVEEALDESDEEIKANVIRAALERDLTSLIELAHAQHKHLAERRGSAVLFLDEVQEYDGQFLADWFGGDVLGRGGIRREWAPLPLESEDWDADKTILPVIMVLSEKGAGRSIVKHRKEHGWWLLMRPLDPFPVEEEADLLAYEHVLLNPFDRQGILGEEGVSKKAYVLSRELNEAARREWCKALRKEYGGLPAYFKYGPCYETVPLATATGFLKEADDETRVEEWVKKELQRLQQAQGPSQP